MEIITVIKEIVLFCEALNAISAIVEIIIFSKLKDWKFFAVANKINFIDFIILTKKQLLLTDVATNALNTARNWPSLTS